MAKAKELPPESDFDELAHTLAVNEELADRLRIRDHEIARLSKLLTEAGISLEEKEDGQEINMDPPKEES